MSTRRQFLQTSMLLAAAGAARRRASARPSWPYKSPAAGPTRLAPPPRQPASSVCIPTLKEHNNWLIARWHTVHRGRFREDARAGALPTRSAG